MKKVLAGILLIVFLFNVGGYYIVFWGLKFRVDQELTHRLDANRYDPEETIELKIPVALPYPIQSEDFQRVDGRFEHDGHFFKLVKHKLENDTLYVVCIRDVQTRELVDTMKDYVRLTQELPWASGGKKALTFLGKLVKDFYPKTGIIFVHPYHLRASVSFVERPQFFLQPLIPIDSPPPKV